MSIYEVGHLRRPFEHLILFSSHHLCIPESINTRQINFNLQHKFQTHPHSSTTLQAESLPKLVMGIRLPSLLLSAKQIVKMQTVSSRNQCAVPKGHIAVYVGDNERKRFVVPISYLNHPSFSALLKTAEEEFGFKHPTGGLTIPCREEVFINLTSSLQTS